MDEQIDYQVAVEAWEEQLAIAEAMLESDELIDADEVKEAIEAAREKVAYFTALFDDGNTL